MNTDNYKCTYMAKVENVEVRKVEEIKNEFTNKSGSVVESSYLLIQCDDENEDRIYFEDRNVGNINKYRRGAVGTFVLRVDFARGFGEKNKITVVDFIENGGADEAAAAAAPVPEVPAKKTGRGRTNG